jgi:hypothetical protein
MKVEDGKENRTKVEGFKVTEKEKVEIAKYCKEKGHDKSKFFRNAIARAMQRGE